MKRNSRTFLMDAHRVGWMPIVFGGHVRKIDANADKTPAQTHREANLHKRYNATGGRPSRGEKKATRALNH